MITFKNIELQRMEASSKGKAKYLINGKEYFAEEAAIHHYENLGYHAIWSENSYWWTLMSLLFWDVIFSRTKGAVRPKMGIVGLIDIDPSDEDFENQFLQTIQLNGMPADFFTSDFYPRRKSLINNRIQELYHSDLEHKIIDSYQMNYGKYCRPIENWDHYSIDDLLISIRKMDKGKFLKILERLISNFNDNRAGLPDLFVFNNREIILAEIKSEKDRLSKKQIEWHIFLSKSVGLNIEILLINASQTKMKNIKKKYFRGSKEVLISFGYSASKKRDVAISFIQKQDSFFTEGESKNKTYGAIFKIDEDNIESLFTILDLTSGWKSQKIEVEGEVISSKDIRDRLKCLREKTRQRASLDWCRRKKGGNLYNKFGCNKLKFKPVENDVWQDYGYFDTTHGIWIFDKNKILKIIEEKVNTLKVCPFFDEKKVWNVIKKLPTSLNPKEKKDWALISNDQTHWYWHKDHWIESMGERDFPGFNATIGVEKVRGDGKKIAISNWEYWQKIKNDPPILRRKISEDIPIRPTKKKIKKKACFIATAVYGDVESYEVKLLRSFRDESLVKSPIGRLFIKFYYFFSPPIADFLKKHKAISRQVKGLLDGVLSIICHR